MFEKNLRISFDLTDPGGRLFFGSYFQLAHQALEDFVVSRGISWDDWFNHPEYAVPIVHTEADYGRPLLAGSDVQIRLSVEKLGESSATFHYEFVQDGKSTAKLQSVHVFVDKKTGSKLEMPKGLRGNLSS